MVVEVDPVIRIGLIELLNLTSCCVAVGSAADGADAVEIAETKRPDVILFDLAAIRSRRSDIAAEIRNRSPRSRIVVTTVYDAEPEVEHLLRLGPAAVFMFASFLSASTAPTSQRLIGRRAPEFIRKDLRGETIDLARYRGKVGLLNFWATWCAPCRAELPHFNQWQAEFKTQGFQIIAVAMDDDPALVRNVVGKLHLALPVVIGDAKLGDLYGGVSDFPVSYLIDRDGIVRHRFEGETQPDQFKQRIRVLLKTTQQ